MKPKKIVALLLALLMLSLCVAGCGNTPATPSSSGGTDASETGSTPPEDVEPIEIVYVRGGDMDYFSHPDLDEIQKTIEDKFFADTGVKIHFKVEPIPFGEIVQKYQQKLAGKEKMDLFRAWPAVLQEGAAKGYYKDLSPYVEANMPDLSKAVSETSQEAMKVNGKYYSLYSLGSDRNYHINVRTDILEELGIEFPNSFEELEEALAQVKEKDPSLTPFGGQNWCISSVLKGKHNLPVNGINSWQDEDGTLKPLFTHPNYKAFLEDYARWYANGWLSPDFNTQPQDQMEQEIFAGQCPFYSFGGFYYWPEYIPQVLKVNPNATTKMFTGYVTEPEEESQYVATSPLSDGVSVMAYADDKVADAITKYINWEMSDPENYRLTHFGIEGKHYVMNGDKIEIPEGVQPYNRTFGVFDTTVDFDYNPPQTNWDDTFIEDYETSLEMPCMPSDLVNLAYFDLGDMSTISVDVGTALTNLENDAVMGNKTVDDAIAEMNKVYYETYDGEALDAKKTEVYQSMK